MTLGKELMNLNARQIHIEGVETLKINNLKNLMINDKNKVEELYTKDDVLNLDFETVNHIKDMLIRVKSNKDKNEMLRFRHYINVAVQYRNTNPLEEFAQQEPIEFK